MPVELGEYTRDKITGFSGTVVGRARYLYGERRALVQGHTLTDTGLPTDPQWIDEQRLEEKTSDEDLAKHIL